jgi:hypothetical protein
MLPSRVSGSPKIEAEKLWLLLMRQVSLPA